MSSILDALKKSEQERKLNNVPTLSDMPAPQENARWPLYVIAVLSLVLAVVIGVLLSPWFSVRDPSGQQTNVAIKQSDANVLDNVAVQPDSNSAKAEQVVINVISYSDSPRQRFVMLDGKMYREKDFVRAGLKVDEIKPNSVVLNLRGELITRTP